MTAPLRHAASKTAQGEDGDKSWLLSWCYNLPDFLLSIQDWELGLAARMKKMGKKASRPLVGRIGVGSSPLLILIPPFLLGSSFPHLLFFRKLLVYVGAWVVSSFPLSLSDKVGGYVHKIPTVHDGRRTFFFLLFWLAD